MHVDICQSFETVSRQKAFPRLLARPENKTARKSYVNRVGLLYFLELKEPQLSELHENTMESPSQQLNAPCWTPSGAVLDPPRGPYWTASGLKTLLYNICRVRPFLTQEVVQVLIQARHLPPKLLYNSLLAGLPACAIKPPVTYPEHYSLSGVYPEHYSLYGVYPDQSVLCL